MRLWHKDLIPFLPQKQLIAQWRELCCIAKNLADNGTPNHLLVNKILNYTAIHFEEYCNLILQEMHKRGYKVNETSYLNLVNNIQKAVDKNVFGNTNDYELYSGWMNKRYLKQCCYNLQEKYDCGGMTKEEYERILVKLNESGC